MATFVPPITTGEVPPVAPGADRLMNRLCALYQFSGDRGRNVYLLSDGTVTETDPDGVTVRWDNDTPGVVYVAKAWWGGHLEEDVTAAEAAALVAAGYTVS